MICKGTLHGVEKNTLDTRGILSQVTASRMHQTLEVLHLGYCIQNAPNVRSTPSWILYPECTKMLQVLHLGYCIARNLENFHKLHGFVATRESFSVNLNLEAWCSLAWLKWAICESFLCENHKFHQLRKFSSSKVSCYMVLYPEYTKC